VEWIPFPDERFVVSGLPWFGENSPHLWRLAGRFKSVVREPVWWLATNPSGARLRFRTNAATLAVRLDYPESATAHNLSIIGQMGVDLYLDGRYYRSAAPRIVSAPQNGQFEHTFFEGLSGVWREVCIYLPLYAPAELLAVGVNEDAQFGPPTPFAVNKPAAFYGSSITQGGCASRPGMSYQAILGRMLNIDFVNLGFSGNGMGEPELAQAMAEIDASCYVIDFAQNIGSPDGLRAVYGPFLRIIREKRPEAPMICNTPIYASPALWHPDTEKRLEGMRQVIREAVAGRKRAGDKRIWLTEGLQMLGPDRADAFVDGAHPSDVGFQAMAEGFRPVLAKVLGL
jgi:hypothetical protein